MADRSSEDEPHRVLFLLKNGIGYGHFQRTLVIAEELRCLGCKCFFICQAGSLKIFEDRGFPVFNFPFLARLPNNLSELVFTDLIDGIIDRIDPDVVIEDTYPDDKYLSMPSVQNRRKVLILRRMNPMELNGLRLSGHLQNYERILCLEQADEFFAECNVPELRTAARFSAKFSFLGSVFKTPTKNEIARMHKEYKNPDFPLVVVNAGAGGEHLSGRESRTIFKNAIEAAKEFETEKLYVNFVIVGGVYNVESFEVGGNVKVVGYEPHLAALLAAADICIVRPGYNVVHEALCGGSKIIAIPGVSYMEQQAYWVKTLARKYGVKVCEDASPSGIIALINESLQNTHLQPPDIESQQTAFAQEIINVADSRYSIGKMKEKIFVCLKNCPEEVVQKLRKKDLSIPHISNNESDLNPLSFLNHARSTKDVPVAVFTEVNGMVPSAQEILEMGISCVIFCEDPEGKLLGRKQWSESYHPDSYGIMTLSATQIVVSGGYRRRIDNLLEKTFRQEGILKLCLNFEMASYAKEEADILVEWLASALDQLERVDLVELVSIEASNWIDVGSWRPRHLELRKLRP